jgi:YfiH family protein
MQFKILKNQNLIQGISEARFGSIRNSRKAIKFLRSIGYNFEPKNLVWAEQVFSNRVHICKKEDGGKKIRGVDGLISSIPKQILIIKSADCLPILIYDRRKKVVAALHGGRECLVKGIIERAVEKMRKNFLSKSKDFLVAIGPHIRVCHYWLRKENYQKLKKKNFKKYFLKKKERIYFDLTKLAKDKLLKLGVRKNNIEDCKICTFCQAEKFFSFRKEKENPNFYSEKNPRFISFIGLLKI